jgi:hypothetical protein
VAVLIRQVKGVSCCPRRVLQHTPQRPDRSPYCGTLQRTVKTMGGGGGGGAVDGGERGRRADSGRATPTAATTAVAHVYRVGLLQESL